MKAICSLGAIVLALACASSVIAQVKSPASAPRTEPPQRHEPPAQAYADCKGKKAGDVIQHSTPEGTVAATCQDSPKGLVARPKQPKGLPAN